MANTYNEASSAAALNTSRQAFNDSLRALLTNFAAAGAPPTTANFIIEGDSPSSVYQGVLYYDTLTKAIYVNEPSSTSESVDSYPYNKFTRIGIGTRIINSYARALDSANIAKIEIGELVVTVGGTDETYGNSVWLKTASNQLTDIRLANPLRQTVIAKTVGAAYTFTGDTGTGLGSNEASGLSFYMNSHVGMVANLKSFVSTLTANVGTSAQRWNNVWARNANLTGGLAVMGNANVGASLTVGANLTVQGNVSIASSLILGSNTVTRIAYLPEASHTAYRANTPAAVLTTNAVWQSAGFVTLTYSSTVTANLANGWNFDLTLTGNCSLAAPTTGKPGQTGSIIFRQDGSGNRGVTFDPAWIFPYGTDPTLSTAGGSKDILTYIYVSASEVYANLIKGFA
jgi:hypothetical protein